MSCNVKVKSFPTFNSYTICNYNIFQRDSAPSKSKCRIRSTSLDTDGSLYTSFDHLQLSLEVETETETETETKVQEVHADSIKRAHDKALEIAFSNDFKYFITLTLDSKLVNRYSPCEVGKKLRSWLNNQVKRYQLKYLIFPEYHKDGAIHFHGLVSGNLKLVDSGTLLCKGYSKPLLITTALSKGLDGITVYNLEKWTLGFSTAIEVYGDYSAAVYYCMKYITKDSNKIFGNYYFAGGGVNRSVPTTYGCTSFDTFPADSTIVPFTTVKFKYFIEQKNENLINENNSILKDVIYLL